MGMKSRASELDREAKKIKSDDSNNIDKVSPRDWVQSTPRTRTVLPRQPIIDLGDLPETTCEQFDYLLQAIGDASPGDSVPSQYCGSNQRHQLRWTLPAELQENRCDKIVATVIPLPYAIGCLAVEVKNPTRYTGDRLCLAYLDERRTGSRFQKRSWQKNYGLTVQSLARKAALSYNREVLGWWVRKIARSETPLRPFKGKEEARRQFLSGDMYVGDLTVRVSGM
ncbi:hypothetical protein RAB80_015117 [Fusarium oxysporum f. sp. vasinfectum]|nr:hypothetical protein RAB80_015117 [Fusarium oxysporum f. sp. vasinfectum]